MCDWHSLAAVHALRYNLIDGLFDRGPCIYCGLLTVDFCPECEAFVCRGCDVPRHWPTVGIFPDAGLFPVRPRPLRRRGF